MLAIDYKMLRKYAPFIRTQHCSGRMVPYMRPNLLLPSLRGVKCVMLALLCIQTAMVSICNREIAEQCCVCVYLDVGDVAAKTLWQRKCAPSAPSAGFGHTLRQRRCVYFLCCMLNFESICACTHATTAARWFRLTQEQKSTFSHEFDANLNVDCDG